MGIDDGRNGPPFSDMFLKELPGGTDDFGAGQRINHDPSGIATNERNVRQIEAANLIDIVGYLVESVIVVPTRLSDERWIDRVKVLLTIEKLKPFHIQNDMASEATWPASAGI